MSTPRSNTFLTDGANTGAASPRAGTTKKSGGGESAHDKSHRPSGLGGGDIMMMLDTGKVKLLREQFESTDDGLNLHEFVLSLMKFIEANPADSSIMLDEEEVCADLIELFEIIDVNGDGRMAWDEFTSYIVEAVSLVGT